MPHYLLELYLPRDHAVDPVELAGGAKRAAEQSPGVSYLRSMVLPEEELCFHVFGGPSAASVAETGSRLGMPFERVIAVLEVSAAGQEDP